MICRPRRMIYNTAGVDDIHAVRDDVRTPNVVFFFYFFGIGVSFVLDGAWLHEVPAPDNACVSVGEWLAAPVIGGRAVNFLITLQNPVQVRNCAEKYRDTRVVSFLFWTEALAL